LPGGWFIGVNGAQQGPYELSALPGAGLTRETLVWRDGMASWTPARQVPELASLFASLPPPLPPPPLPQPPQAQPPQG
jgi:hypothetical protein